MSLNGEVESGSLPVGLSGAVFVFCLLLGMVSEYTDLSHKGRDPRQVARGSISLETFWGSY